MGSWAGSFPGIKEWKLELSQTCKWKRYPLKNREVQANLLRNCWVGLPDTAIATGTATEHLKFNVSGWDLLKWIIAIHMELHKMLWNES